MNRIDVGMLCVLLAAPLLASAQTGEDGTLWVGPTSGLTRVTLVSEAEGVGGADVAIVAAAAGEVTSAFFTDPANKMLATGQFASVTLINAGLETPSVFDLMSFDAVLVWSNFDFADAAALGDNLADYVDNGRGVVLAVYGNTSNTAGRFLSGRWDTDNYDVVVAQAGTTQGSASLGAVQQPAHQIMQNVASFAGGTQSARPTTASLQFGSASVAQWSDGKPLAAIRTDLPSRRVDLGFYPPSDDVLFFFWNSNTDGDWLLANALSFAAGQDPTDVAVRLVALTAPGTVDTTTDLTSLPNQLGSAGCGPSFVLELWVSDLGALNTGVLGVYVDVLYDPAFAQATSLVHTPLFPAGLFAEGAIDNASGSVINFGSFNFSPQGIAPTWARLGYITMSAIEYGTTPAYVTLGIGGLAVSNRPPPPASQIDLVGVDTTALVPGDFENDCDVDLRDIAASQNCFGLTNAPTCAAGDFNNDGTIGLADHAEFAVVLSGP